MKNLILLLVVLALVAPSLSVPYSVFVEKQRDCMNNASIPTLCTYDIFHNTGVKNGDCARDLYRSQICQSTFDDCYNLSNKT